MFHQYHHWPPVSLWRDWLVEHVLQSPSYNRFQSAYRCKAHLTNLRIWPNARAFGNLSSSHSSANLHKLQRIQNSLARIVAGKHRHETSQRFLQGCIGADFWKLLWGRNFDYSFLLSLTLLFPPILLDPFYHIPFLPSHILPLPGALPLNPARCMERVRAEPGCQTLSGAFWAKNPTSRLVTVGLWC